MDTVGYDVELLLDSHAVGRPHCLNTKTYFITQQRELQLATAIVMQICVLIFAAQVHKYGCWCIFHLASVDKAHDYLVEAEAVSDASWCECC